MYVAICNRLRRILCTSFFLFFFKGAFSFKYRTHFRLRVLVLEHLGRLQNARFPKQASQSRSTARRVHRQTRKLRWLLLSEGFRPICIISGMERQKNQIWKLSAKLLHVLPHYEVHIYLKCRSQWPRRLSRGSAVARLMALWVRIPPAAWLFDSCECCVSSGRSLCVVLITLPEESYRLWCVR